MNKNSYKLTDHLRFIIPSVVGVFLFMMPITTSDGMTIPVALLADVLQDALEKQLSSIMMVILVITAILSVIAKIKGTNWLSKTPFFHNLLHVSTFWTVTRVLAAIFAIMVLFELGPVAVYSEDTGGMILHDLLHVLFAVFLFAGLFLPLLMNFGLLEMFGTIMTKVMRPLFKIPGRSSIDALASWIDRKSVV